MTSVFNPDLYEIADYSRQSRVAHKSTRTSTSDNPGHVVTLATLNTLDILDTFIFCQFFVSSVFVDRDVHPVPSRPLAVRLAVAARSSSLL